ncbi:pyrophosphatase PpaX [Paenibacillus thailandensis]|uniref:Pyrophosphatase PpaX n=1 Tax=Paenibacillus thailandensis TaxID=393250 RepID=A0ABW5R363_9BACL
MTGIRTVLFDLDGTILDTNELIIRSFMEVLKDVVPEGFTREHIIPKMGEPLELQFQHFSGLEDVSHLVAAYRKVNLRLHDELVKPFPYVAEVLKRLRENGIQIGVVTTKIRMTTEKGLAYIGIRDYVDAIVTIDDIVNPKPHPEPVLKAIELLGAEPASTMMVGDSVVDIMSAEAAGTVSVGVAWSLKGERLLRDSGAQHIIRDMRDLYELVGLEREPLA